MSDMGSSLSRELYILEDENNPHGSKANTIWPTTTLDQVFDPSSPINKNLRTILDELHQEILSAGIGSIVFPVTSVNGMTGDIIITKDHLNLHNVDNTKDIDKPLSDPQRKSIMEILQNFVPEVDLSDLYNHLGNFKNPHGVTLDQINHDGSVEEYVLQLISKHNTSLSEMTHKDIREAIKELESKSSGISDEVEAKLQNAIKLLEAHYYDPNAHSTLFDKKEDLANKATEFSTVDHVKYPSTRAVVEYVAAKMVELRGDIEGSQTSIEDIIVIDSRDDLPIANTRSYRKSYFIRYGINNSNEVAVCRLNPDGKTYSWDISTFNSQYKFNPDHFIDTPSEVSLNIESLTGILLSQDGFSDQIRDSITPEILSGYYTKDEIDDMHYVSSVHLLSGTQPGTIRFYINGNMDTMSEDVKVTGIADLAFLNKVGKDYIETGAVQDQHIANRAVKNQHIDDEAVTARTMKASYNTVFGNVEDSTGTSVREIPLESLAEILDPLFKINFENIDFIPIEVDYITSMVDNIFQKVIG